jgi:hypothetical protein
LRFLAAENTASVNVALVFSPADDKIQRSFLKVSLFKNLKK